MKFRQFAAEQERDHGQRKYRQRARRAALALAAKDRDRRSNGQTAEDQQRNAWQTRSVADFIGQHANEKKRAKRDKGDRCYPCVKRCAYYLSSSLICRNSAAVR
jgi:hypothetical protein